MIALVKRLKGVVLPKFRGSMKARLLISSAFTLLFFLGLTGLVLDRALVASVRTASETELRLRAYSLLAEMENREGQLYLPRIVREESLNNPQSGIVALVLNDQFNTIWQSASSRFVPRFDRLVVERMENITSTAEGWQFGIVRSAGVEWYAGKISVNWASLDAQLQVLVLEDKGGRLAAINEFRRQLWWGLAACGFTLMLSLLAVVKWTLVPLRRLSFDLSRMKDRQQDRLQEDYPDELQPVTDSLNMVVEAEREQRLRYRDRLADLAHSLKTPLAVLGGMADDQRMPENLRRDINDQVARMDQVVQYQLRRAVHAHSALDQSATALAPMAQRLSSVVVKAYQPEPDVDVDVPEELFVPIGEDDLLEVLGNLIENAAKYGRGLIQVGASENCFWVEDNGHGIPEDQHAAVFKRGVRVDTLKAGQGIGLAVVDDIVKSYGAKISISESEDLGGAKFTISW
ncbi:ATP-binding protein [Salinibius halmophilus]|uniref:ATP-binding protein n=1 Tax=Salinibius halmophilus TaxID=1853216 RepID=UPI000E665327|nr:ATP-binding protein [Salinibius halmophilus]